MSSSRAASKVLCSPVWVIALVKVAYILTTCAHFDTFEFDVFDADGPQCHFIMSVAIAVGIRTLSVHYLKINLVC